MATPRATRRMLLIALGLSVLAGGAGLYASGALDGLSDPEAIRTLVRSYGALGPLVFIAIAMAAFPLMLMGPPVWASMLLWPWPSALLYSYTAAILSSVIAYGLARRGSSRQQRIPEKLERYRDGLLRRPIATVFVLRVVIWANPLVDVLIAVSGVPLRPYLVGTLVGMLPPTLFQIFLGAGLQRIGDVPAEVWVLGGVLALAAAATWALRRRRTAQAP